MLSGFLAAPAHSSIPTLQSPTTCSSSLRKLPFERLRDRLVQSWNQLARLNSPRKFDDTFSMLFAVSPYVMEEINVIVSRFSNELSTGLYSDALLSLESLSEYDAPMHPTTHDRILQVIDQARQNLASDALKANDPETEETLETLDSISNVAENLSHIFAVRTLMALHSTQFQATGLRQMHYLYENADLLSWTAPVLEAWVERKAVYYKETYSDATSLLSVLDLTLKALQSNAIDKSTRYRMLGIRDQILEFAVQEFNERLDRLLYLPSKEGNTKLFQAIQNAYGFADDETKRRFAGILSRYLQELKKAARLSTGTVNVSPLLSTSDSTLLDYLDAYAENDQPETRSLLRASIDLSPSVMRTILSSPNFNGTSVQAWAKLAVELWLKCDEQVAQYAFHSRPARERLIRFLQ